MVTPMADVRAASILTPRMQAYCVKALRPRLRMWGEIARLGINALDRIGGRNGSLVGVNVLLANLANVGTRRTGG